MLTNKQLEHSRRRVQARKTILIPLHPIHNRDSKVSQLAGLDYIFAVALITQKHSICFFHPLNRFENQGGFCLTYTTIGTQAINTQCLHVFSSLDAISL